MTISAAYPDTERWRDSMAAVATYRYIPPSRLGEYDTRYDQGLENLLLIETLIDEDCEQ